MRATFLMLGATALAFTPALASAQTAPGQGQYHGTNYWHSNSGNAFGQPGVECEDLIEDGEGAAPGNTANAPGTAFGGSAHDRYAGEQPQNSRNSASSSQYDVACAKQPL